MNEQPKVLALLLCNEVVEDGGLRNLVGVWHTLLARIHNFPWSVTFKVFVMVSGDFRPESVSITIFNSETKVQVARSVKPVPTESRSAPIRSITVDIDDAVFPNAGRYTFKFDADGISPFLCELELI